MVFFSCGACNETLKKNQVEKHYTTRCRRCEFLSCIDCGKEFWGDSYQTHTKCISEEEKYSGKNFVAKPNKGEVKQEQWIQKVQSAIKKTQSNPQLRTLLQRLEEYPNIPRKKAKFENFLKCSLRVINKGLVNQVWELLMAETQQQNGSGATSTATEGESGPQINASSAETAKPVDAAQTDGNETERKLNKRERKEKRKNKMNKAEKKDKQAVDATTEEDFSKKKKRKRDEEKEEEENDSCNVTKPSKKKKRKEENDVAVATEEAEENGEGEDSQDSSLTSGKSGKFNWGLTITAVLEAKGEMSVKRLQKKNGSGTTSTATEGESGPHTSASSAETANPADAAQTDGNETERKLNKRERKEKRKNKMNKAEKKDKQAVDATIEEDFSKKKKRNKDEEEKEEENDACNVTQPSKKKKRKEENDVAVATGEAEENGEGEDSQDSSLTSGKSGKFNWGLTITAVLEAKGEMSVKRLQKKVLAEYASYGSSKLEEKLLSKFHRKLSKLPNVKVLKDKARLIQS